MSSTAPSLWKRAKTSVGQRACKESEIGRGMTDLRVDLSATRELRIAICSLARVHVRSTVGGPRVIAAKKVANGIGHQDADHAYFTHISVAYKTLRLGGMCGVMPGAANQKLGSVLLCNFHQVPRLRQR